MGAVASTPVNPDNYNQNNNSGLKTGYTTGATAAAAARAAALFSIEGIPPESVEIIMPSGITASFTVHSFSKTPDNKNSTEDSNQPDNSYACTVRKNAGDDPDITNGALITCTIKQGTGSGIHIMGGDGVGMVTRPGLGINVGEPAITAVPHQMITEAVGSVYTPEQLHRLRCGIEVMISVDKGEELARKTLNSRLGVVGGISILGTTGVVYPYSTRAYTDCISCALNVAAAAGLKSLVLTTGRRTEKFAQKLFALSGNDLLDCPNRNEAFIQIGDYLGYSLKEAVRKGFSKIYIAGMPGKLVKMAQGNFQTHANRSEIDKKQLETMLAGIGIRLKAEQINTVRELFDIVMQTDRATEVLSSICRQVSISCENHVDNKMQAGVVMFNYEGRQVAGYKSMGCNP